jgi:hypothetical protein
VDHIIVLGELGEARSYWLTTDSATRTTETPPLADDLLLAAELLDRRVSAGRHQGEGTHTLLRRHGLPTTLIFWPNPSHVHTPADKPDSLDPHKLATAGETLALTTMIWAR